MKKTMWGIILLSGAVAMAGCGNDSEQAEDLNTTDVSTEAEQKDMPEDEAGASNSNENDSDEETSTEEKESDSEAQSSQFDVTGLGEVTVLREGESDTFQTNTDDPQYVEIGPMKYSITDAAVVHVALDGDGKYLVDEGVEEVTAMVLNIEAENTSAEDKTFYPAEIVTTDTGEQMDYDVMFTSFGGGEFFGETKQGGTMWFIPEYPEETINSATVITPPPYDSYSLEDEGEEQRHELTFTEADGDFTKDDLKYEW